MSVFPVPTPEVRAVLFDYGMVLSGPPNATAWARLRQITGLDEATLQREYWAHRHAYDRGTHTGESYFQQVASGAGLEALSTSTITSLLDADTDLWTDLNQPMVDWAQELQRRGIRTGILSNLGDAMHAGVQRKFSWLADFDHCTWSHALQMAKPEQAIYEHAAQGLRTVPAEILFVDDKPENIEAALGSGMQAIQYVDHDGFLAAMSARGLGYLL